MKKKYIIIAAVLVVVIVSGIVFIPKLVHICDDCEKFFVGTGYEVNVVSDLFSKEDKTICKECAEKQHAVTIAIGKSVGDYKKKLFD